MACVKTCDELFDSYVDLRRKIVELLRDDPERLSLILWKDLLSNEEDCTCIFSAYYLKPKSTVDKNFLCSECRNVGRLLSPHSGRRTFRIECGKDAGEMMILREHPRISLHTEFKRRIPLPKNFIRGSCGMRTTFSEILECDSFTLEVLSSFYMERLLRSIPNTPQLRSAYVCRDSGFMLYMNGDEDNPMRAILESEQFKKDPNDVIRGLILQVIIIQKELSKYDVAWEMPTLNSLDYEFSPCSYKYDGKHIESPITLKIGPIGKTSINVNTLRLSPAHPGMSRLSLMRLDMKSPLRTVRKVSSISNKRRAKSYIVLDGIDDFLLLRSCGLGISSVIDTYSFITSITGAFLSPEDPIFQLWKRMWLNGEMPELKLRTSFEEVLEDLAGKHLDCHIEDFLLDELVGVKK